MIGLPDFREPKAGHCCKGIYLPFFLHYSHRRNVKISLKSVRFFVKVMSTVLQRFRPTKNPVPTVAFTHEDTNSTSKSASHVPVCWLEHRRHQSQYKIVVHLNSNHFLQGEIEFRAYPYVQFGGKSWGFIIREVQWGKMFMDLGVISE